MTKMDGRALKKLLKAAIEAVAPDLRKTMALPRKAKVTAVRAAGGTYVCSVQPVLNDGRPDPDAPVIPDVEIPCIWAGPDRGLICPPTVGEFCDLGFYDGDPNCPFIMSFRPSSAPVADLDELMIQHSPGVRLGFKADGTVIVEAPKIEAKATEHIKADAPLVEVRATARASISAPVIELDGHVQVTGGISVKPGKYGRDMEMDGHLRIVNGGVEAQLDIHSDANLDAGGSVKAGSNVSAGGDVTAGGKVIDSGGNTNHHSH